MNVLESILDYLEQQAKILTELEWKGLCEKLQYADAEGNTVNQIGKYISAGEFDNIDFDSAKALIYLRKEGEAQIKELDEEEMISCEILEEINWNMIAVFSSSKDFRQNDDAYTADQLALALKDILSLTNPKALLSSINAVSLISRVQGYETNLQKIVDAEQMKMDYTRTFISLKLNITMQAREGCINYCE